MRVVRELLAAVQFLTRIPVPQFQYDPDLLVDAAKFYPLVGAGVGGGAILLEWALRGHLPAGVLAALLLGYLVAITGGFHEDGLADTADGIGGGRNREHRLEIMRDSRIGSFGSLAICLSLLARWALLTALLRANFAAYVLAAHVLCRWTTLPLCLLAPARAGEGLGNKLAQKLSRTSVIIGSVIAFALAGSMLRIHLAAPLLASVVVTLLSGWYYRSRLGGITGDCFGATNQLAEIAVYACGVWS
jgi:adenosylcobinamide-GDP ribazoletransferase